MNRIERYIERLQQSGDATKVALASIIQMQTAALGQDPDGVVDMVDELFRDWQLTEEVTA